LGAANGRPALSVLDVVGVWDELDEVELDVEAHPVRNDVVIT
jgi:hypothetical protein